MPGITEATGPLQVGGHMQWIASIDGLRALAVLIDHANSALITRWALGNVGVAVFFSISGFLAYYVLYRDEQRLGQIDYNYFLFRRVLRIWPAYLAIIALVWYAGPESEGKSWLPLFTSPRTGTWLRCHFSQS